MAKFKKMKRRASRYFGGFRKKSGSKSAGMSVEKLALAAGVYGAARAPVVGLISPLTSKLPLGGYEDEVVLGLASYFAAKKGSGFIKQLGYAGLCVEAATATSGLTAGMISGAPTKNSNNSLFVN